MNDDSYSGLLSDVEIAGAMRFGGYLNFDGRWRDGEIIGENLLVGPLAVIEGSIHVTSLILHGSITGDVVVTGHCELKSTASLAGSLVTQRLIMHDGAALVGSVAIAHDAPVPAAS